MTGADDKVLFPAVSKVKVTFSGTPDTTKKDLLANTGTSKGVGVRLINADGAVMKVGDTSVEMPLVNGANKLTFSARVEANGNKVETGSIISQATYALNYL
ncbi:fimbrial family protein [Providencia stuartii]|nr:fimbrial family protein [Providencia stuartii]